MTVKYYELTLAENFSECQDLPTPDTPTFFSLLDEHLNYI